MLHLSSKWLKDNLKLGVLKASVTPIKKQLCFWNTLELSVAQLTFFIMSWWCHWPLVYSSHVVDHELDLGSDLGLDSQEISLSSPKKESLWFLQWHPCRPITNTLFLSFDNEFDIIFATLSFAWLFSFTTSPFKDLFIQ